VLAGRENQLRRDVVGQEIGEIQLRNDVIAGARAATERIGGTVCVCIKRDRAHAHQQIPLGFGERGRGFDKERHGGGQRNDGNMRFLDSN
jgi:hypothetical protein